MADSQNNNNLVEIIQGSGLEVSKANFILENFQDYFKIADEWKAKSMALVVTDENDKATMKMAREGRLFLRAKRIDVENARKKLKEQSLREGKAIDGIANVLKALIEPIEEYLSEQENFAERMAQQRRILLVETRVKECLDCRDYMPGGIDFGTMPEEDFQKLLAGARLAKQSAEQLRIAMEQEQIEKARLEAEERERIKAENEKLRIMATELEKEKMRERAAAQSAAAAAAEALYKERVAREKIEEEARQAKAREAAEIAKKEAAEKAAAAAPDKEKLIRFANMLHAIAWPDVQSEDAANIVKNGKSDLVRIVWYINEMIEKM